MDPSVVAFNTTRLEHWQRALMPGQHFAVVVEKDMVVYGRVVCQEADEDANAWLCKTWCEAIPKGAEDVLMAHMLDLPLTKKQFQVARKLKWPTSMAALRALVSMQRPAQA